MEINLLNSPNKKLNLLDNFAIYKNNFERNLSYNTVLIEINHRYFIKKAYR
jgi:hypothetical protein